MIPDWVQVFNTFAWVAANLLIGYIALALIVFVVGYQILFDPKATTAGKFIFRFAVSLIGVIGLVYVGIFIDPNVGHTWYHYHSDTVWWRPVLRLTVYLYVAYTITALAVLLAVRKWKPKRLKTALDHDVVRPRHDTSEVLIIKGELNE